MKCGGRLLTNEMPEACAQLNLGLDKRVSIRVESHKENLLHLIRKLTEAGKGRGCDRGKHL